MAWYDSSKLKIHPGINIGLQYIINKSEYIPKLQLHQHSLLTRKVFYRHNLLAQVFFSISSRSSLSPHHLHLQVISIFKSPSSSSHLHLDLDLHSIWIIINGSGSSLDRDHLWSIISGSGSSLNLDHLCWIINTESSRVLSHDSSHHRKFYRANPFSWWMHIYRANPFSYWM